MNEVGKTLARAFKAHKVPYIAVDHERQRFLEATAAGYIVAYGQTDDLRFWNTLGVAQARAICIASPRYEVTKKLSPIIKKIYPSLKRYVAVNNSSDGVRFATLGMIPFNNSGAPPGLEIAIFILKDLDFTDDALENWIEEEQSAYLDAAGHKPVYKETSAEQNDKPANAA
jgi:Trk K+ transport system NAD-binding subunit